jgi:protein-S-isoprenylcysteine O-methyltransferase Ste14
MYLFLFPLLLGFAFNWASAFTDFYSRRFGDRRGRLASFITRNILGIPVWVVGLVLAFRASAPPLFVPGLAAKVLGWVLVWGGTVPMIWALVYIRLRAYRPTRQDALVSNGVYRFIRHPIYTGLLMIFFGGFLLQPRRPVVVAVLLGFIYVYVQARLEEVDLLRRMPAYREYMERVPRFFPRLGKRGSPRA